MYRLVNSKKFFYSSGKSFSLPCSSSCFSSCTFASCTVCRGPTSGRYS
ncbi:hypothetical protein H206_05174 [Candidatus Electrothrix aarhusensis]|uniref:Uncharacterized protein n=1 Tax=Candidatus Electrothrix aarhusensis TaxID=1859131 RepID=A0A444J5F7_9BACT|nr:hypothetical protein H206_05174 [Candidatus Electrothrix aarhusensis]